MNKSPLFLAALALSLAASPASAQSDREAKLFEKSNAVLTLCKSAAKWKVLNGINTADDHDPKLNPEEVAALKKKDADTYSGNWPVVQRRSLRKQVGDMRRACKKALSEEDGLVALVKAKVADKLSATEWEKILDALDEAKAGADGYAASSEKMAQRIKTAVDKALPQISELVGGAPIPDEDALVAKALAKKK